MTAMSSVREISPKQIRALRLKKNWSVDDLAHELRSHGFKTNGATISKWERGIVDPRASVLPALAAALDATIDDLYAEAGTSDDEEDRVPQRQSLSADLHRLAQVAAVLERRPDLIEDILAAEAGAAGAA